MGHPIIIAGHFLAWLFFLLTIVLTIDYLSKKGGKLTLEAAYLILIVSIVFIFATAGLSEKAFDLDRAERVTRLYRAGLTNVVDYQVKALRECDGVAKEAWLFSAQKKKSRDSIEGYICPSGEIVYL